MPNADNTQGTEVSEPTVNEESVDTSTKEEAPETEADNTDLEDMDISFDDVADDETEESDDSESEIEDTEPAESEEESAEDAEESKETEDSEDNSDKESDERKPSDEDIKRHNQEMAAKRIAEKQSREAAKRMQHAEYLQGAQDAYDRAIDAGLSEQQAQMEVKREMAVRQLQVDAYNNLVEKNVNKLENDMQKAVSSIELFQKGSPEVKEELLRRADDFEQKYVVYDKNGDPTDVNGSLYEYLQNEADSIQRILNTGARNQSKAKDRAKSRTETLPSRAPKEPKVDPDLVAFDEEVAKWA